MAMGLFVGCYTSYVYNQNMLGPGMSLSLFRSTYLYLGMPNAPATDMVNFEIEVIDMARNNYTPIGYYRNGEFKPHQVAAPAGGDEEEED